MSTPPVLILGTGRCGSTLLSEMIRDHPQALSVSELFSFLSDLGMRIEQVFPRELLTGRRFWELLAEPQPRQSILLRHGLQMPEVIYPWDRGRFTAEHGVPPILQGLLPHLDPVDPDTLFDEIGREMAARPEASIGEHYRAFFGHLQQRFAKDFWVERSGGSLRVAARLIDAFPEARVLHLVRDGRDTALSMSRHIGFRMALLCGLQAEMLGTDPYESDDRSEEEDLTDDLAAVLPERFTPGAFDDVDLSPAFCGHYWSGEVMNGLDTLGGLPADRLLTVRYEDLLTEPSGTIETIGRFLNDRPCPRWVARATELVEHRPSRWTALPTAERHELELACRPGFEALADHGMHWSTTS